MCTLADFYQEAFGESKPKETVHYQVPVYPVCFPLVEMVQEPCVGVDEEFVHCASAHETFVPLAQVEFFHIL